MPEAEFNVTYCKSVPRVPGATIKQAFQQASSVPFSLIVNLELADNEERVDLAAEDLSTRKLPSAPASLFSFCFFETAAPDSVRTGM
jgi:hypothetical protein